MSRPSDPPLFDHFAMEYSEHATDGAYNALYDRPAVLEVLGQVGGSRVLDIGCGPGLYAEELFARGAEVVGFDESGEMVRLAHDRCGERFDVRVHDLRNPLDWLPDETFEAALMALVIHHLDDRVAALREIRRVLRPGGRLVVSTHHPASDWVRLGGSYFAVEPIEEDWHHGRWHVRCWRLPLSRTCEEFIQSGFLIERIVEPLPAPEMADRFPESYDKLMREPAFIIFALRKPFS